MYNSVVDVLGVSVISIIELYVSINIIAVCDI